MWTVEEYTQPPPPSFTIIDRSEAPRAQAGIRESCEDQVCAHCSEKRSAAEYKACKSKCFYEKAEDIATCCSNACNGLPQMTQNECSLACANPY